MNDILFPIELRPKHVFLNALLTLPCKRNQALPNTDEQFFLKGSKKAKYDVRKQKIK